MSIFRAAQITRPGRVELIPKDTGADHDYLDRLDHPPEGRLTIAPVRSGVCGTDIHIFKGEYLGSYPIIPGHEFAGTVTAVGEGVADFSPGDRVAVEPNLSCGTCSACRENRQHFCENWQAVGVTLPGAMATAVSVPQEAVFSIGDLDFQAGAFMEPLSCVIHGVEKVGPRLGGRTLLIGAGPIGILLMRVLRAAGVSHIDVAERNVDRSTFAENAGSNGIMHDLSKARQGYYDLVVDATGSIPVLEKAVDFVRPSGKILFFGVPPRGEMMKIEPFKLFNNELTILSSFTSLRNSIQAVKMMQSGQVEVSDLVSHVYPLGELQRALELLSDPKEPVMKVMIDPGQ